LRVMFPAAAAAVADSSAASAASATAALTRDLRARPFIWQYLRKGMGGRWSQIWTASHGRRFTGDSPRHIPGLDSGGGCDKLGDLPAAVVAAAARPASLPASAHPAFSANELRPLIASDPGVASGLVAFKLMTFVSREGALAFPLASSRWG